jgi:hypothetical protein
MELMLEVADQAARERPALGRSVSGSALGRPHPRRSGIVMVRAVYRDLFRGIQLCRRRTIVKIEVTPFAQTTSLVRPSGVGLGDGTAARGCHRERRDTGEPRAAPPAIAALASDLHVSENAVRDAYESKLGQFVDARIQMFVPLLAQAGEEKVTPPLQAATRS